MNDHMAINKFINIMGKGSQRVRKILWGLMEYLRMSHNSTKPTYMALDWNEGNDNNVIDFNKDKHSYKLYLK